MFLSLTDLNHLPTAFSENATAEAIVKFKTIALIKESFSFMQHVVDSKSTDKITESNNQQIIDEVINYFGTFATDLKHLIKKVLFI